MPVMSPIQDETQTIAEDHIAISVKGKWVNVPASYIDGKPVVVKGKLIRVASVHDEAWLEKELDNPDSYVRKLKERGSHGVRADIFTFAQKLPAILPKYQYFTEWDSVAAADTSNFKNWWEKLPQESRKNVRRSQKRGVTIKVRDFDDELIKGIIEVNDDSAIRQGRLNAHYGKSFEQTKLDHSAFLDRSEFICAYLGDELIGFLKIVYRGESASILNLAAKSSHYDKRPANALLAKAVEICEAKGMTHLTYGMFNYGNKRDSPLREFKSRNGFDEILVPRFYVPLTIRGKLYIKLGFHRGLLGIVPHGMITMGVSARTRWYNFKQSMSRCSSMPERPNRTRQTERSNPPAGSNI